ncbi:hypothetical protein [Paraburkholderia kirstenboschensis]|uniref:Uncharacterized protein n=1 Tax=Paraburkholderia kirstenboschensis TaxID=1245436 RepID=A0ABZ0EKP1_9BURK|nr:hypothetical protein [Paraburkholderia kirstenboschensis]WOD17189.1 hypothetical protein RW095_15320 [Paraburkholderia kirstenboschensis]
MDNEIDKTTATAVSTQLLDAFNSVENAMRIIQERCSQDEFEAFRSEAGKIAGGLYLLLEPLWRAYPDIAPEGVVMARPEKKGKS